MAEREVAKRPDFQAETRDLVYIREAFYDGKYGWAVFDHDGEPIHHHEHRSRAFFFAEENGFRVLMRH